MGIVVLQADLQLDGFGEVALAFGVLAGSQETGEGLTDGGSGEFAKHGLDGWKVGPTDAYLISRLPNVPDQGSVLGIYQKIANVHDIYVKIITKKKIQQKLFDLGQRLFDLL